ncbi:MAG TPA: ribosome maturation factor RimM [Longimicrobiales bacterium]
MERPDDGEAGPEFLVVGHITKPHGTKGEVYVWPLTDRPEQLFAKGRELVLGDSEGAPGDEPLALRVERVRAFKRGLLVKFEGFPDRTAVEPFSQRYLLVPAEAVPPLEEGEVFYHQLLGLEVVTTAGEVVGRVREVFETEPAHLLDVQDGGRSRLIPFVERIVREVDLEAGRIVIEPPPGLLDV